MVEKLGVDIWGTIRPLSMENDTMPMPDVFWALQRLVSEKFGKEVWLVSAAATGQESLYWLKEQNFYEKTGVLPGHVKFCRIWDKSALYDKLGFTHIIDDNDWVLMHVSIARYRYLFHADGSLKIIIPEDELKLKKIQIVTSWRETLNILLPKAGGI